jgi:UDP-N-acetylmuramoylalanine--D-glutamate ligase
MNKDFFGGRKVLVMGLGRFGGGVDAAIFACRAGAKVTVTDQADAEKLAQSIEQLKQFPEIELHLGSHCAVDFAGCDVLVVNPAVRPENEFVALARKGGAVVTSQIELFFQLCPARIIGITGSNGKSTTSALTAHLLRCRQQTSDTRPKTEDRSQEAEDRRQETEFRIQETPAPETLNAERSTLHSKVFLGGNLGDRPLLTILDEIKQDDLVVLELSSFQLEQLAQSRCAPDIALITNLAPNHLDRHGTFENYCNAKENIFKLQGPSAARRDKKHEGETRPAIPISIFNADDPITMEWYEKYKSEPGRVCLSFSHKKVSKALREGFALPGRANLQNLAAAVTIARYFGIDDARLSEAVGSFKSLPHRLELVAEVNGVRWYNDSVSTTPESSIVALDAFSQPKIIIAGGYDKGVSFEELGRQIAHKAKAAVLIGKTAKKIADSICNADKSLRAQRSNLKSRNTKYEIRNTEFEFANSMADAVRMSAGLAEAGDVVLLSPACASYDMFDDFRHRGEVFKECVKKIGHGGQRGKKM